MASAGAAAAATASSAGLSSSDHDGGDGDGTEYKMPSMGSLPREAPSRTRIEGPPDDGLPSSSLSSSIVSSTPPTSVASSVSAAMMMRQQLRPPSSPGVPSSASAALVTPDRDQRRDGGDRRPISSPHASLQGSHQSFDIDIAVGGFGFGTADDDDEPRGRDDVYHASADTFPTSNVQQAPAGQREGAAATATGESSAMEATPLQPPFADPSFQQTQGDLQEERQRQEDRQQQQDRLDARPHHSIDTLPISNISNRPSTVTEGSTATASDITATTATTASTGGTFGTSNAVVHDGYYYDENDNDDDDNNDRHVLLHSMSYDDRDIPLEELFANAQRKAATAGDGGDRPEDGGTQGESGGAAAAAALLGDPAASASSFPDVQLEHEPPRVEAGLENENDGGDDDDDGERSYDDLHDDGDDGSASAKEHVGAGTAEAAATAAAAAGTVAALQDLENSWVGPPAPPNESRSRGTPSSGGSGLTAEESMEKGLGEGGVVDSSTNNNNNGDPSEPSPVAAVSTETKPKLSPPPAGQVPRLYLYLFRAAFIVFVLVAVIVPAVTISTGNRDTETAPGVGTVVQSPVSTRTPAPSPFDGPPASPTTGPPPSSSSSPPVPAPTTTGPPSQPLTTDFEPSAVFSGQAGGDRLGTVVSLAAGGEFMAALVSGAGTEPAGGGAVQTFRLAGSGVAWRPSAPLTVGSSSSEPSIDAATTADGGRPVVAVSTTQDVRVYESDDDGDTWTGRGQALPWTTGPNATAGATTASATAVAMSSDASALAAGHVSEGGDAIIVAVYLYDPPSEEWTPAGDHIVRVPSSSSSRFLSMSLALSGDGSVVTVGGWAIASQVEIVSYEMGTESWTPRGQPLTFDWGPVAVSLSHDGQRLATAAPAPGTGKVYEWDGSQWGQLGNEFPGGSSVAMDGSGLRVMVGDPLFSMATVVDYQDSEGWTAISTLAGSILSRFGASVAVSANGNTVAVGSPLDDRSGDDSGQVSIYD